MLGDTIETALGVLGITSDRVERWVGKPCGCKERREKLNSLHNWAHRIVAGKLEQGREYLEQLINE